MLAQSAQPRPAERACEIASLVEVKAGDERVWQAANNAFALGDGKAVNPTLTCVFH
jgi:hypothetical protein